MNEQVSVRDHQDALHVHAFWRRLLLASMAVAFTVCSSLPGEALNGEPIGAEGLHRTGACETDPTDFTISCDDRPQSGVVSCHMRGATGDEGLAINTCVDGRVATGGLAAGGMQDFLERDVTIRATDFGEFVCGKELLESESESGPDELVEFCLVCDTFVEGSEGASHCVKITADELSIEDGTTCGAFNVSRDTSALCPSTELELQQFFSDPRVAFTIGINGNDAGFPGGALVEGEVRGKDLLVCGSRSWQCIDVRPRPLVTQAQQVQEQRTHALIDTPCCMRLSSGRYYCSSTLTPSATCK